MEIDTSQSEKLHEIVMIEDTAHREMALIELHKRLKGNGVRLQSLRRIADQMRFEIRQKQAKEERERELQEAWSAAADQTREILAARMGDVDYEFFPPFSIIENEERLVLWDVGNKTEVSSLFLPLRLFANGAVHLMIFDLWGRKREATLAAKHVVDLTRVIRDEHRLGLGGFALARTLAENGAGVWDKLGAALFLEGMLYHNDLREDGPEPAAGLLERAVEVVRDLVSRLGGENMWPLGDGLKAIRPRCFDAALADAGLERLVAKRLLADADLLIRDRQGRYTCPKRRPGGGSDSHPVRMVVVRVEGSEARKKDTGSSERIKKGTDGLEQMPLTAV